MSNIGLDKTLHILEFEIRQERCYVEGHFECRGAGLRLMEKSFSCNDDDLDVLCGNKAFTIIRCVITNIDYRAADDEYMTVDFTAKTVEMRGAKSPS